MECEIARQRLNAMAKRAVPATAADEEIRVLLEHYRCPVPFHEVRARFLGNIATPAVGVSPIKMVERLWSGELPEFNSIDAANELIAALIMGLWNRLTRHQERSAPFRLVRPDVMATREGLATLAMIRCQEIDGFVEGLFGDEETIGLRERAHRGLAVCGKTGKFELLPFRYGALCWWFSRLARHKRLFLVSLRSSPMRQPISGCGSGCRR